MSQRPLVSFLLLAYNQERFIREAVAGAFAQTYSPLEIILSDDCSSDRTFKIMQDMVAAYQGAHKIILNRNSNNQGIGGHVNRAMKMSQGTMVVTSAGDDISLPMRTQKSVELLQLRKITTKSMFSNAIIINRGGERGGRLFEQQPVFAKNISEFVSLKDSWVAGCTHCFRRELFDYFGPLRKGVVHEDRALAFRAILKGEIAYLEGPLVLYRRHGQNTFMSQNTEVSRTVFMSKRNELKGWLLDLDKVTCRQSSVVRSIIEEQLRNRRIASLLLGLPIIGNRVLHYSVRLRDSLIATKRRWQCL
jgi:glycosyltransferase involved in cell wall biosynthesis